MRNIIELLQLLNAKAVGKTALFGSVTGIILVTPFLVPFMLNDHSSLVFLLPYLTVAIGCAVSAVVLYIINQIRITQGWNKFLIYTLSVLFFLIVFWISMGFAFAITGHWN